jgi:hypothetical protein
MKDDTIRYERYFNGYRPDSTVASFSVAKAFVSALVGIAIADGVVHSSPRLRQARLAVPAPGHLARPAAHTSRLGR